MTKSNPIAVKRAVSGQVSVALTTGLEYGTLLIKIKWYEI
jgi:hypothetical protein